jgi:hypothetical protein
MKTALMNFSRSFATNFKTILFALILAVIVWLAISFQLFPNVPKTIQVPVSVDSIGSSLELAEEFSEIIEVRVEGKRYDVGRLTADDFHVSLDFSEVDAPGEHEVEVVIQSRVGDDKFIIMNPVMRRTVTVIQTDEKTLTVRVDLQNVSVADNMTIINDTIKVDDEQSKQIKIWGEKSLVESINRAQITVYGGGEALAATTTFTGELVLFDLYGGRVDIEASAINVENRFYTVTVPVYNRKTLSLSVDIINVPQNFNRSSLSDRKSIIPEDLTIAAPDLSDNLVSWSLGVVALNKITLRELREGLLIPISLPDGMVNMSGDSQARVVFVFDGLDDEYGEMAVNVRRDNFNILNIPPGFTVNYITRQIPVKIVGPSSVLRSMTADDIYGTINFAGMDITTGSREIGIKFEILGTDVLAWVIDEYKIDIEILPAN